jgi:phosphate transport system substrate-binding protein
MASSLTWDRDHLEIRKPGHTQSVTTAIASLNRSTQLPSAHITVVHGSDGGGTTWIWSRFFSEAGTDWKARVGAGTSFVWPVGVAAEGNEGVANLVQGTPNSIAYATVMAQ